jgi:hypothetical protein
MKFKIFKFKKVKSTNNTAIRIIKNSNLNMEWLLLKLKQWVEVNMEKNGFLIKEIYL